ncbi:MAG TPA: IPT/TIG domain-containing protein [Rhodothermales bacterium]
MVLASCDGPVQPNYYGKDNDPLPGGGDPPTLVSVEPDRGFPGDEVVLTGQGFRPDPDQTMINFGTTVAEIVSATDTEIVVRVPANESGNHIVRAAVWGAEEWSNQLTFTYLASHVTFGYDVPAPKGVAVDDDGNLYLSSGTNQAVYRVDGADSTIAQFASLPVTGPMEFGPEGALYVVTSNGVDRIMTDGSVQPVLAASGVVDFDWADNDDLFVLTGNRVHRWSGGTLTEQGTVTQGQRIRVFDGYVYVTELSRARVSRFPITGAGLGAPEVYFNAGTAVMGLDIDSDGALYAGGYVRDYVLRAAADRADDGDVTQIPNEEDRANPFRKVANRLGDVYLYGSVMYLVQDDPAGKVWRIFIGAHPAPRYGRD